MKYSVYINDKDNSFFTKTQIKLYKIHINAKSGKEGREAKPPPFLLG